VHSWQLAKAGGPFPLTLAFLEAIGFLLGGENLDILAQRALIAFERQDVVGLLLARMFSAMSADSPSRRC